MDRFVYFNCTYGSKKDKPMIMSRENSLLYDTEEQYHTYKEVAICFYKKNNALNM